MPELWVPGVAEPSLDAFVQRLLNHIERFGREKAGGEVAVEVELRDSSVFQLASILPEPGYGFITLCPHADDGEPQELIVPVGALARITLERKEEQQPFGFTRSKDA
jgi:hypothetical protein